MDITLVNHQINSAVSRAKNCLIVCHPRPDADAAGSLAAMAGWFDQLNKSYILFCRDPLPANLEWLINFKAVITDEAAINLDDYDLLVVLDSGDLNYAGIKDLLARTTPPPVIINIDHHATNQNFGGLNLVDPAACSTTAIIYQLFKSLKVAITPGVASALLAGVIGDTYNFTNPNTDYQALQTAADLLVIGASLPQVSNSILKNKNLETLQTWGQILSQMYYNVELGIVVALVLAPDLGGNELEINEGIANFLNNLTGVKAALILQQQSAGTVKGSLRTNDDLIDVSELAKILGGGGHVKAAGFKLAGQLVETPQGWQVI